VALCILLQETGWPVRQEIFFSQPGLVRLFRVELFKFHLVMHLNLEAMSVSTLDQAHLSQTLVGLFLLQVEFQLPNQVAHSLSGREMPAIQE
jgi:hypothetical protein